MKTTATLIVAAFVCSLSFAAQASVTSVPAVKAATGSAVVLAGAKPPRPR